MKIEGIPIIDPEILSYMNCCFVHLCKNKTVTYYQLHENGKISYQAYCVDHQYYLRDEHNKISYGYWIRGITSSRQYRVHKENWNQIIVCNIMNV